MLDLEPVLQCRACGFAVHADTNVAVNIYRAGWPSVAVAGAKWSLGSRGEPRGLFSCGPLVASRLCMSQAYGAAVGIELEPQEAVLEAGEDVAGRGAFGACPLRGRDLVVLAGHPIQPDE